MDENSRSESVGFLARTVIVIESPGRISRRSTGEPLDLNNIRRRHFYQILERAELSRIRMHDVRHTHATLLLAQDVHPKSEGCAGFARGHT